MDNKDFKSSHYNIIVKNNDKNSICFNTKLDSFCILPNHLADILKSDVHELAQKFPKPFESLYERGFIIDRDKDEFAELKKEHSEALKSANTFKLTILPSLDCNLKCWYCFENHIAGSHLTKEVADSIRRFVKKLFNDQPDLNHLEVELFGGEPLLYFKEELYPLLKDIKDHIDDLGKSVSFFFVTNAVCITEDIIPLLKELNASFQISIDGFKDRHDKIKYIPETGEGTYDRMIRTIYSLTENIDNTYINLRINYDDETLGHMPELMDDLRNVDRKKIGIHLERVWQTGKGGDNKNDILKGLINRWMANGFTVSYMNLGRRGYSCKASSENQAVIACDGAVYKCSGRDFTENHRDGTLLSDGTIEWKNEKLKQRLDIVTFENDMCRECIFLPLCWGPCCQKQMEADNGDLSRYCQKRNMELKISDYVLHRVNSAIIRERNFKATE